MLNSGMFTSDTSEWATPQDFFDKLNAEFHFTLDPCATPENAKCGKFYTKEQNGLTQNWTGETVFCNPPYGKEISAWVEKCYKHSLSGECAVMLIPSRTDTRWFHEWVYGKAELRFVKGRLRFNDSKGSAPFPSLVVVYRGATHDEKLPPAQLSTDLIRRQAAIEAANKLVDRFEQILRDIRETNEDDSVCGMCEYDGAFVGQSGDWCSECPGFEKDDCFRLSDECRKRWLESVKLPSAQPEIIRCRECKFASGDSRICMKFGHSPIGELDFCAWAESRIDDH